MKRHDFIVVEDIIFNADPLPFEVSDYLRLEHRGQKVVIKKDTFGDLIKVIKDEYLVLRFWTSENSLLVTILEKGDKRLKELENAATVCENI